MLTDIFLQGTTHTAVTPLDLVKCRRQVDAKLYKGNFEAWGKIYRGEGLRGVFTGWGPTFFGYSVRLYPPFLSSYPPQSPCFFRIILHRGWLTSIFFFFGDIQAQGAFKYGGYEFFKKFYSDLVGDEKAHKYKTSLYLTASASAEFFADIALCPFEAVKVRMQTTIPPDFKGTFDGISSIVAKEGTAGLYKGLYPLWGRQIPYTMMKFASFETIVEQIYKTLPGVKTDYSKGAQTAVAFSGGYLAGILCAIVSHPADVMVSKLNANRQPGEAFGKAMGRIYGDIGFRGLWNGLPVRIVMIGTLVSAAYLFLVLSFLISELTMLLQTGLQWMIYDSFKIFMGLPTTGGGEQKK